MQGGFLEKFFTKRIENEPGKDCQPDKSALSLGATPLKEAQQRRTHQARRGFGE